MFPDTTALDNTIYILGDKEVNYPTYEVGELEPFKKVWSEDAKDSESDL